MYLEYHITSRTRRCPLMFDIRFSYLYVARDANLRAE